MANPQGLTDEQRELIEALASPDEATGTELARAAGYDQPGKIDRAGRSPLVQAELKLVRSATIRTTLAAKAMRTMEALLADNVPAATRLGAAKWVLEQAGHGSQVDDGKDKPLHEMTEAELLAFMHKAQRVVDDGGSPPIIAVKPDNGA